MSRARGEAAHRRPVWRFFAVSHGVSWACWGAALLLAGSNIWDSPARWLVFLGGLGPPLAGFVMTYATEGRYGVRELALRLVDPRRIPLRWMIVALMVPVLAMAGAVAAALLVGTAGSDVDASRLFELLGDPLAFIGFALFVLVFGPIPEEIGWRGYALDALQSRWTALTASLVLGAAWALWHAPLFFIAGYYGEQGAPGPVLFVTAILVNSVLYTWIYNHTARSILVAVVFHFMVNFVGMLVEGAAWVEWTRTGFTAAVVAYAIAASGARLLGRKACPITRSDRPVDTEDRAPDGVTSG
jgi:uncharacterized protein